MPAITISDLNNAQTDVQTIAAVATSTTATTTDRLGNVKKTLKGAVDTIRALNPRGPWVAGTTYDSKDLVQSGGTWYIALDLHTAGSTFSADAAAHWRVYQGLTTADLADSGTAALVGSIQAGSGAVARTLQAELLDGCLKPEQFGAVGASFGGSDDTIAVNRCFEAARLQSKFVLLSTIYNVSSVTYGTQSTSGQSSAPLGIIGYGLRSGFKQIAGASGTVLKALGIGGSVWRDFSVDANGNANQCIDTSYATAGPSLHNDFSYIRCQGSTIVPANGAIWKATNNNDCGFRHIWCIGVNASVANQVAFDYTASGGNNNLDQVYCVNGWLRIGVQNGVVHGGWFFGVVLLAGSEDLLRFSGTQHYPNPTLGAHVVSESFATFASTKALYFDTCWFINAGGVSSVFNVNLYSTLVCTGCNFLTTAATNLLGSNTRSDSNASVKVSISGGESSSSLTLNDVGAVHVVARDLNNNTTGLNFSKNWSGTLNATIAGLVAAGTATYTSQTINWIRDGNTVTFSGRITWSGHTGTGQMSIAGLGFTQVLAGAVVLDYSGSTLTKSIYLQPTLPTIQLWNTDGSGATSITAAGDIIFSGSCVVLP